MHVCMYVLVEVGEAISVTQGYQSWVVGSFSLLPFELVLSFHQVGPGE